MNENVYIVTYDLFNPEQNYERLLSLIKSEENWARLGGASYLVTSSSSAVELRDKYKQALESKDKLYVGVVTGPAAWTGYTKEVSDWIKQYL